MKFGKGIKMESRTVEIRRRHGLGLLHGGMLRALWMFGLIGSQSTPDSTGPKFVIPELKVWETTEKRDRRPLLAGNRGKGTRRQRKADKSAGRNLEHHEICMAICVGRKHYGRYASIRGMILRQAMLTPQQRLERDKMREAERYVRNQVAETIHMELMKHS